MLLPTLFLTSLATSQPHSILYTLERNRLSSADLVTAQCIQGLANREGPRVWLKTNGVQEIVYNDLVARGAEIKVASDVWDLASKFKSQIKGTILYKSHTHGLNIATSLAGPMQGIAIDESQLSLAKSHRYRSLLDVQGLTEPEAFEQFHTLFKKGIVVEQSIDKPGALRDFAVMHSAFVMDTLDRKFRKRVVQYFGPNSLVFGWGPDEYEWITEVSSAGGTGVAADWCVNLSALEKMHPPKLKRPSWAPAKNEDNVRYVAFVLSDGDNLQWQTGGFVTDPHFYGSQLRGSFPFTWEVSPLLARYAPSVLDIIYRTAKPNDDFVTGAGLPGYTYPHVLPNRASAARQTRPFMAISGLRVASILNQNEGSLEEADPWLDLPNVDAVIYKDYSPYHRRRGETRWHNGKPTIAYRNVLWEKLVDVDRLASEISKMPTDPKANPNSYALINVHAWSFGKNGGPMEAVRKLISMLPPNTRVVTASQLVDLIIKNKRKNQG